MRLVTRRTSQSHLMMVVRVVRSSSLRWRQRPRKPMLVGRLARKASPPCSPWRPLRTCGKMTVNYDKAVILSSSLDLSRLLGLSGNDAWVGFTAGSGQALESEIASDG